MSVKEGNCWRPIEKRGRRPGAQEPGHCTVRYYFRDHSVAGGGPRPRTLWWYQPYPADGVVGRTGGNDDVSTCGKADLGPKLESEGFETL